ncbi:RICIN domain-containing protein [Vibrio algarum]|uniref:RICIN domain-containing protein n=1 Tax=Vibrio algarum TaxID=3020714 RepID=A0ABT4YUR4_9VIBR|nr:RICIN domain-containing protein [Vibrio sp. KJ40-1]MDB1125100.1 RICIN domain-containing protein [Vibrio sp. KJ40-1]
MYKVAKIIGLTVLLSSVAMADNVEVYVIDLLDNTQNGYCLDIAKGKGADANPADGMQAHTCYSPLGEVLVDQAFDPAKFAEGVLYMPEFDVCMQVSSIETGASPELTTCDGSEAQSWVFDGEGTIAPAAAPEMCLTLTGDTRTGRSDENQMKAMTLVACSDDLASVQTWSNRTAD